jgi:hypothetical protein
MSSLKENKQFFTAKAKRARELYHAIGTPLLNDFKSIIRMNIIGNNPVTTEDINIAEQIFGSDIGALKGKTVRRTPRQVIDDTIEIPHELIQS